MEKYNVYVCDISKMKALKIVATHLNWMQASVKQQLTELEYNPLKYIIISVECESERDLELKANLK